MTHIEREILIAAAELAASMGWQHGGHEQKHQAIALRVPLDKLRAADKPEAA